MHIVSQEAGQVVWYSHLFQNFPQFIVIHTVKGFGIGNKAKIDVFSGTLLLFQGLIKPKMSRMELMSFQPFWSFDLHLNKGIHFTEEFSQLLKSETKESS